MKTKQFSKSHYDYLRKYKTKRFLLIQDNKINKTAFIDYDNIGMFSRIMIIKER